MTSMASTMRSLTAASGPVPVAGGVALADLGHLVAEAGPLEVAGVGVDDGVGEQVAAGQVDAVLALAHAGVDVGVDRRRRPPLRTCSTDHGTCEAGQVVEQHAVGHLAGQPQHRRVERADHHLRLALAEADAEPEALAPS